MAADYRDDPDEWAVLGRELQKADPRRYLELLSLARKIIEIHRDPYSLSHGLDPFYSWPMNQKHLS